MLSLHKYDRFRSDSKRNEVIFSIFSFAFKFFWVVAFFVKSTKRKTNEIIFIPKVLSGDCVIIRGYPKGGPPPEKQITFSNILAPKLARRPVNANDETRDEPWAWEAREFLRKKLIGEEVYFTSERPPNSTRDYGTVYLGPDPNTSPNVTELLVQEGLVAVRRDNARNATPELQRLIDLEDIVKSSGKGKWGPSSNEHVRNIRWSQENPRSLVDQQAGHPLKAIIEHVRDGSTVRAFLLPDFQYVTLMISGIRVSCELIKILFSFLLIYFFFLIKFIYSVLGSNLMVMVNQIHQLPLTLLKKHVSLSNPAYFNVMLKLF